MMNFKSEPNMENLETKLKQAWTQFVEEVRTSADALSFPNVEMSTPEIDVSLAYGGQQILDLHSNSDRRIYMASSIKLPYVFAFLNLYLLPNNIGVDQPLNFIDQTVAEGILADLEKDPAEIDPLAQSCIPLLPSNFSDLRVEDKHAVLKSLTHTPRQIIEMTLGPSSNLTMVAIRDMLANQLFGGEIKVAANAVANFLNTKANELLGKDNVQIAITRSDLADLHGFNTAKFEDLASLFRYYLQLISKPDRVSADNLINTEFAEVMRSALASVVISPDTTNHSHEIKVILHEAGVQTPVMEKSGYFFWPDQEGNGRISINTFAQVEVNEQIIDIYYSVELPYVTALDPTGPEFAEFVNGSYKAMVGVITNAVRNSGLLK